MNLRELQRQRARWADENFGPTPAWQNTLGVCEEAGELAHAILKRAQHIRGDDDKHQADAEDAVGDIVMYLMGVCDNLNVYLEDVIQDVAKRVMQRDWVKHPDDGGPSPI